MAIVAVVFERVMPARAMVSIHEKNYLFPQRNRLIFEKFGDNDNGLI